MKKGDVTMRNREFTINAIGKFRMAFHHCSKHLGILGDGMGI